VLKHVADGQPVCVTVTLLDGLVFARSVFHHSMNYRSAVLFGSGRLARDDDEKMWALQAITEHIARGRWEEARIPNPRELKRPVYWWRLKAPAKHSGPPKDDEEDLTALWPGYPAAAPGARSPEG
jgi:nitroimidazol reductase NimA-like FMN-containing flavoprotein (pyridoxamine 5'-phosphate oxidase superfamily)